MKVKQLKTKSHEKEKSIEKEKRFPEGVARFFNPEKSFNMKSSGIHQIQKSFKSNIPVYNAGGTYIRRIHNARNN